MRTYLLLTACMYIVHRYGKILCRREPSGLIQIFREFSDRGKSTESLRGRTEKKTYKKYLTPNVIGLQQCRCTCIIRCFRFNGFEVRDWNIKGDVDVFRM